jgi:hypothetical protein
MVWAVSFETITSVGFSLRAVRDPFAEERASEIVERRESRLLRPASRAGRAPFGVCRGLLVPDTFPQPTPITLASMDAR